MDYKTAVQAALNGDDDGFLYLYQSTYTKMYHTALILVKNKYDAEDVLQDSYLKAKRSLNTLTEPDKFPAWFNEIVVNTSKNYLKKKKRKPICFIGLNYSSGDEEFESYDFKDENNLFQPEESYSDKEIEIILHEMIDSLSDEQRMCILMYYFDEQSVSDIADITRCSVGTVKSRLFYGRKALRKKIEAMQNEGYRFYGAAPIPIFKYFMERYSVTSDLLNAAKMSMENSKAIIFSQTTTAENYIAFSVFEKTVAKRILAVCLSAVFVGGGLFSAWKVSDFRGFVQLSELKDKMIENINNVNIENSTDTDTSQFTDDTIFDTDIFIDTDITETENFDNTTSTNFNRLSNTEKVNTDIDTEIKINKSTGSANRLSIDDTSSIDSDKPVETQENIVTTAETNTAVNSGSTAKDTVQNTDKYTDNVTSNTSSNPSSDFSTDSSTDSDLPVGKTVAENYAEVLDNLDGKYGYYLADLDKNGITELITLHYYGEYQTYYVINNEKYYLDINIEYNDPNINGFFDSYRDNLVETNIYSSKVTLKVYTCVKEEEGYKLQEIDGELSDSSTGYYDLSDASDEKIYSTIGVHKEDYVFDPWALKSTMATSIFDNNLYFIIDDTSNVASAPTVYKIDIFKDRFKSYYVSSDEYYGSLTFFDTYEFYDIIDRTPLQDLIQ